MYLCSSRLCNLPYVLWVTAQCLAWLLLCLITDILTTGLSGSSSSAPSTLLSSRILAAGFMSAATGAAAAGGVTQHAGSAATTVAGSGAKSRPGARRSIGGQPAMAAAAGGDAAADGTCAVSNAASGAGAAAVRGASSAPSSPLVKKRSAAAGGVTPGLGVLVQPAARGEATAAVPGTGSTSCGSTTTSSTTSSGGSSSPERHRKQLQQQQHDGSPSSSNRSAVVSARSSSSNSGSPMRLMLSFNRNMLVLFLLGNLLTGGLNLSVNTLAVGNWTARVIVGETSGPGCLQKQLSTTIASMFGQVGIVTQCMHGYSKADALQSTTKVQFLCLLPNTQRLSPPYSAGVYMLVLCAVAVRLDRAGITLKPR